VQEITLDDSKRAVSVSRVHESSNNMAGMKVKITKLNSTSKHKPFNMMSTPAAYTLNNPGTTFTNPGAQLTAAASAFEQHNDHSSCNNRSSSYTNRHVGGLCLHHTSSQSSISGF